MIQALRQQDNDSKTRTTGAIRKWSNRDDHDNDNDKDDHTE